MTVYPRSEGSIVALQAVTAAGFSTSKDTTRTYRLGELRIAGIPVQVGCKSCGQQGYYDPRSFSAADNTTLEFLADILVCRRCRAANRGQQRPVWVKPDLTAMDTRIPQEASTLAQQLLKTAKPGSKSKYADLP
jgi:hypothetical protein